MIYASFIKRLQVPFGMFSEKDWHFPSFALFHPQFVKTLEDCHAVETMAVNFLDNACFFIGHPDESRRDASAWAAERTARMIQGELSATDKNEISQGSEKKGLVIANELFFTIDGLGCPGMVMDFHLNENAKAKVQMIQRVGPFKMWWHGFVSAVSMPCERQEHDVVLIVPRTSYSVGWLGQWTASAAFSQRLEELPAQRVRVSFPAFSTDSTVVLNEPLKKSGLAGVFQPGAADFSGMTTGDEGLHLAQVVQKTSVRTCPTHVTPSTAPAPSEAEETFVCNRPFCYLIRQRSTGAILCAGSVTNPLKS